MAEEFGTCLDALRACGALSEGACDSLRRRFAVTQESNVRAGYQLASRVFAVTDVLR
jgi:hypothetical protein